MRIAFSLILTSVIVITLPFVDGCFGKEPQKKARANTSGAKSKSEPASKQKGSNTAIPGMEPGFKEIYKDQFVTVISNAPLTTAEAKDLAARIKQAYEYDIEVQQWKNRRPIDQPVVLKVFTDELWKQRAAGALGLADHRGFFASTATILRTDLSQGTLAHELTHMQDDRELQGKAKLPPYLLEGRALDDGYTYRQKLRIKDDRGYDKRVANTVVKTTVEQLRTILATGGHEDIKGTSGGEGSRMEFNGVFFVQFLKTQFGGKGFPDANTRLGRVVEDMGNGKSLEKAFNIHFSHTLESAHAAFIELYQKTEGKPEARLKGTIYEGLVK